jgi:hypothetical protein
LPETPGIAQICGVELRLAEEVAVLRHDGQATESPCSRMQASGLLQSKGVCEVVPGLFFNHE